MRVRVTPLGWMAIMTGFHAIVDVGKQKAPVINAGAFFVPIARLKQHGLRRWCRWDGSVSQVSERQMHHPHAISVCHLIGNGGAVAGVIMGAGTQ